MFLLLQNTISNLLVINKLIKFTDTWIIYHGTGKKNHLSSVLFSSTSYIENSR